MQLPDHMPIFIARHFLQENNKKYFKRNQLISKQQEVHEIDKVNNDAAPSNDIRQLEESVTDSSSEHLLSRQEVIRRLRERGEPILLFGESEIEAFKRLRKCEILEPEVNKVKHVCFFIYILFLLIEALSKNGFSL